MKLTKEEEQRERLTRMTGQSTRLVDKYIQELFTTGKTVVKDHYDLTAAHRYLYDRVRRRLEFEHRAYTNLMHFDPKHYTIQLLTYGK